MPASQRGCALLPVLGRLLFQADCLYVIVDGDCLYVIVDGDCVWSCATELLIPKVLPTVLNIISEQKIIAVVAIFLILSVFNV